MSKTLLQIFQPAQVAWLRYSSATISFFVIIGVVFLFRTLRHRRSNGSKLSTQTGRFFARPRSFADFLLIFGVGFSAFCFAPFVGVTGLNKTGAIDNSLLIALEPLVTVSLAVIFLRERLSYSQIFSFAAAILGFGMLSGLIFTAPSVWWGSPSILGSLILLASLFGEAGYSIFGRKLSGKYPAIEIFGSAMIFGFLMLTAFVVPLGGLPSQDQWAQLDTRGWGAILWLGPLGSTLTYLYWLIALERTVVSNAALTIFVQPIVGSALGVLALGEVMTLPKWVGGSLIFIAVGLLTPRREKSSGVPQ
ncbi:MAG: EamA family transporter [Bdellovibrionales bacterium]|nr:EamA family transporter [Bdellovibrionales bacterium]